MASYMDYLASEISNQTKENIFTIREDLNQLSFEEIKNYMHSINCFCEVIDMFAHLENIFYGIEENDTEFDVEDYSWLSDLISDYWNSIN